MFIQGSLGKLTEAVTLTLPRTFTRRSSVVHPGNAGSDSRFRQAIAMVLELRDGLPCGGGRHSTQRSERNDAKPL